VANEIDKGGTNKVWLNDGNGNYSDSGQSIGDAGSLSVFLGDVDNDGDLDAFIANGNDRGGSNKVWLNDGNGNYSGGSIVQYAIVEYAGGEIRCKCSM